MGRDSGSRLLPSAKRTLIPVNCFATATGPRHRRPAIKSSREDLRWAADHGHLAPGQDATLWSALEARTAVRPRFDAAHVAYYAGALLVLGSMGWFVTLAWESLPGAALTLIAVVYAAVFLFS